MLRAETTRITVRSESDSIAYTLGQHAVYQCLLQQTLMLQLQTLLLVSTRIIASWTDWIEFGVHVLYDG